MEDHPKQNCSAYSQQADKTKRKPFSVTKRQLAMFVLCGLLTFGQSGCSLYVMAGKMLFGDPVQVCSFTQQTNIDLRKGKHKVVVICKSPEVLSSGYSSLNVDLLAGTARQLKREDVEIINPNKVATWMDDTLGSITDPTALAQEFDADIVIIIDVENFSYKEDSKNTLFQGRTTAQLTAYELRGEDEADEMAVQVFSREFVSIYPELYPIPSESVSEVTFRKQYLDRISQHIAQHFYNHRTSVMIF